VYRLIALASLLLSIAFGQTDFGEFLADTTPRYQIAPMPQASPIVATDGESFMVFWNDDREDRGNGIYATRVTAGGVVADSGGIPVVPNGGTQYVRDVAYDGNIYVVVWEDQRIGYGTICASRVTTGGEVLDPDGTQVSLGVWEDEDPGVAGFDSLFFVAWTQTDQRGAPRAHGSRVTGHGQSLEPEGLALGQAACTQREQDVCFDGEDFLLAWSDSRDDWWWNIYATRVAKDGSLLNPDPVAVWRSDTTEDYDPAVACGSHTSLVAWYSYEWWASSQRVLSARLSATGQLMDTLPLSLEPDRDGGGRPDVAFDGTNYLVVWAANWVYGARVSEAGQVLDTVPFLIGVTSGASLPQVAFDGENYLVTWFTGYGGDVVGTRVAQSGNVLDPRIDIGVASGSQEHARVAFGGSNYLVVWQDKRNGGLETYGARVSPRGEVLDPDGIPVSVGGNRHFYPDVVHDGSDFIVVWQDEQEDGGFDIHGARVGNAGAVLDTFPVTALRSTQEYPVLASSDDHSLMLTWEGWTAGYGARLYGSLRVWCKLGPIPGVQERETIPARSWTGPTVMRASGVRALGLAVLDYTGREVSSDERLSPGVYFLRPEGSRNQGIKGEVRKVIVTR